MVPVNQLLGPRTKDKEDILVPRNPRTQKETDNIALYLMDKFNAPNYRNVFLKIAWRLDRSTIDQLVALAFDKAEQNPRAYFITIAKQHKEWHD